EGEAEVVPSGDTHEGIMKTDGRPSPTATCSGRNSRKACAALFSASKLREDGIENRGSGFRAGQLATPARSAAYQLSESSNYLRDCVTFKRLSPQHAYLSLTNENRELICFSLYKVQVGLPL